MQKCFYLELTGYVTKIKNVVLSYNEDVVSEKLQPLISEMFRTRLDQNNHNKKRAPIYLLCSLVNYYTFG